MSDISTPNRTYDPAEVALAKSHVRGAFKALGPRSFGKHTYTTYAIEHHLTPVEDMLSMLGDGYSMALVRVKCKLPRRGGAARKETNAQLLRMLPRAIRHYRTSRLTREMWEDYAVPRGLPGVAVFDRTFGGWANTIEELNKQKGLCRETVITGRISRDEDKAERELRRLQRQLDADEGPGEKVSVRYYREHHNRGTPADCTVLSWYGSWSAFQKAAELSRD